MSPHEDQNGGVAAADHESARPQSDLAHADLARDEGDDQRVTQMQPGVRVRIIRVPYFGLYGEIIEMPSALEVLDTGGSARVLKVKLDSDATVVVPRANIELM